MALIAGVGACSYERDRDRARQAEGGGGADDPLHLDPQLVSSLESFDACDDLLAYLHEEGAKLVGPYGFNAGGPTMYATGRAVASLDAAEAGGVATSATADSAAPTAPPTTLAVTDDSAATSTASFSDTNVQEAGVDEPDLAETDGRRLVTVAGGRLRVLDVTEDQPRLLGSLPLDAEGRMGDGQLLLHGDRVAVLRPSWSRYGVDSEVGGVRAPMPFPGGGGTNQTTVTVVDLSDPASPRVDEEVSFDGALVAARMVGGVVRLVVRSAAPNLPFLYPSGSEQSVGVATEANRKVVAQSTLDDWLPHHTVGDGKPQRTTDCRDVSRPATFSGLGMVTVVSLDVDDPRPGPGATVLGAGETVYASTEHLYVTSSQWTPVEAPPCPPNADCSVAATRTFAPGTSSTDIHSFAIGDRVRTTYEASGRVTGHLLSSYSLSEDHGVLRVATTDETTQSSAVVVLRRDGDVLEEVGSVEGLGKGERIYAVRFLGDRGYVVTFRQTDPLHVLDLHDPEHPTLAGELHLPGYSAYLHPIDDHRLLGIGQDATEQGRIQGTQVTLFDVADAANPTRLAGATLPFASSEAEFDPHAFLWWAPQHLAVVPVQRFQLGTSAGFGFDVGDASVVERGHLQQPDGSQVRRTMVVGERLLTLSDSGVATSDLTTFAHEGWLTY